MDIKEIRREYPAKILQKEDLIENPFDQFLRWFEEALAIKTIEINAMTLATASKEARPSCRTVLLKHFNEEGLIFYTNYESRKAEELEENPFAMTTIFWHEQMRQICVEGKVERISLEESQAYFSTRPRGSQLGAWASRQDTVVESRELLDEEFRKVEKKYQGLEIPLPPFWGGYRLIPNRFEFWQGHANRLHDRFEYCFESGKWIINRLSP